MNATLQRIFQLHIPCQWRLKSGRYCGRPSGRCSDYCPRHAKMIVKKYES